MVPNFRVRTIPVMGALPAVFGMAMASAVLAELGGQPLAPAPPLRFQPEQVTALLDRLVRGGRGPSPFAAVLSLALSV